MVSTAYNTVIINHSITQKQTNDNTVYNTVLVNHSITQK